MKIFIGQSKVLGKRWLVQAKTVEDATGKVMFHCKPDLVRMESKHPGEDLSIDLKFKQVTDCVVEL